MKNSNKDVKSSFDSNFDKVAHALKDDTTVRSRKRHLKERQQNQWASKKLKGA